ncbi:MAG: DUF308 domain-containing protein [Alphaproteobacteria bacterium]|nr:DUF308 domain-containing protein [Alphaproteobacteria bacterium]
MAKKISPKIVSESIGKLYGDNSPLLLFESVLFLFAAILIFLRPVQVFATLTWLLGAALALFGIYQLLAGFFDTKKNSSEVFAGIFVGIVNIVLGLVFFLQPVGTMFVLVYIFAALFLVKAIRTFILALDMRRAKAGRHALDIVMSLGMGALAVATLFFPLLGAAAAMYFIGATLVLYAFANFHMYGELAKLKEKSK